MARRNWKTILASAGIGVLAALAIGLIRGPIYHAKTSLEIQAVADTSLHTGSGDSGERESEVNDVLTQVRIVQSRTLIERAIGGMDMNGKRAAVKQAARSLLVYTPPQTRIIEIYADSANPEVAAEFVNRLASLYIQQHVESRWQGAQTGNEKLRRAMQEMRTHLEDSEQTLQSYARGSGLLLTDERGNANADQFRDLQADLTRAQTERVARQSRFEAVANSAEADLPSILNDPAITALQEKLIDLRRQAADLAIVYTPDYPKLTRLEAQIKTVSEAWRKQVDGAQKRVQSEYDEARQRESLIAANYRAQAARVSGDAEKKVHYDILKREVDSTRTLYDAMLARVKEADIASAMRASNIRVIDSAVPPREPMVPTLPEILGLGALAGAFIGFAAAASRQQTDSTIQTPGDLSLALDLRELGAVPAARNLVLAGAGQPAAVESFRSILASLLFAGDGTAKTFVVSSAQAGEGKTTVAANLAVALGAIGKRVLLIDGDLHRPRLHEWFAIDNERGFSHLLGKDAAVGEMDLAGEIKPSAFPGLYVLTCGRQEIRRADRLYSARLAEILAHARKNFDMVLIDSPPLLQVPDARVVGQASDGVVLVVRAGRTAREAALAASRRLAEDGTPITGSVLNDWNPKRSRGYYQPAETVSAPARSFRKSA